MVRGFIERHRSSLLSLCMLALLGLSVLAAMAISHQRSVPARRGALIVAGLAGEGLRQQLGPVVERWYLAGDPRGRVVACMVSVAAAQSDGTVGMDLGLDPANVLRLQQWAVSTDLTSIRYDSRVQHGSVIQQVKANATARRLTVELVQIENRQLRHRSQTEYDRPDNLVPAGLLPSGAGWVPLVAAQVLKGGQSASFTAIPGTDLVRSRDVNLSWLEVTPIGADQVEAVFDQELRQVYRFGPDGPREIVLGDLTYRQVSRDEALQQFPATRAIVYQMRQFYRSIEPPPTPLPSEDTQPGEDGEPFSPDGEGVPLPPSSDLL